MAGLFRGGLGYHGPPQASPEAWMGPEIPPQLYEGNILANWRGDIWRTRRSSKLQRALLCPMASSNRQRIVAFIG